MARIRIGKRELKARMKKLMQARLVEWNGRKLKPIAPVAKTRGKKMVADLLLENRE